MPACLIHDEDNREGVLLGGRDFLDWFRHRHPGQSLEALTAEHVLAAVEHRRSLSATSGTRTAAIPHIRIFFGSYIGLATITKISPASSRETPYWRLAHLLLLATTGVATASYVPYGSKISTGVLARSYPADQGQA